MSKFAPFIPDPAYAPCECEANTDTDPDDEIEAKIRRDMRNIEDTSQDKAEAPLEKTQQHLYPQFTEAQRLAAGYLPKPSCVHMTSSISIKDLRGDLSTIAVPIPKDFLLGDMHGENKIPVYDSQCNNLLDTNYESNKRVAALEGALRTLVGVDMCKQLGLSLPSTGSLACLEDASASVLNPNLDKEIVGDIPQNVQQIVSMPLAKQYKVECKDIVVCPENQYEIAKYILGNSTTIVKPFSIPAGIIACTEDCLVAIDKPTISGQPGQLLAIFRKKYFERTTSTHYNPHTYDVHIENAEVISTLKEAVSPTLHPGSKYAYDMTQ
jgi:hypothetical protein